VLADVLPYIIVSPNDVTQGMIAVCLTVLLRADLFVMNPILFNYLHACCLLHPLATNVNWIRHSQLVLVVSIVAICRILTG
jgi:hypothetical protein